MSKDYVRGIVRCYSNGQRSFKGPFRDIKNVESRLLKFERFALQEFPGAECVNYYWSHLPKGQNFAFRRYLTPKDDHSVG